MTTVGVLALQGAFAEHEMRLRALGCETVQLRQARDMGRPFDALVLPGGESTVQAKLLRELGMLGPLRGLVEEGVPTLGTCAGLILLASEVEGASAGASEPGCLGTFPMAVRRNGYGRQLGSFCCEAPLCVGGEEGRPIPMTFIRAPRIVGLGAGAQALAWVGEEPVAARFGNQVACAFHPELDADDGIYELLLGCA